MDLSLTGKKENCAAKKDELVSIRHLNRRAVRIFRKEEEIVCEIYTTVMETPLRLTAENAQNIRALRLVWLNCRVELWADGRLADEEWPVGGCLTGEGTLTEEAWEEDLLK